ncbi:MAG: SUMF1/EgtB/PvdO family nonheme iron enzyme [Bacteroidetes bacterium]|nr:SUMF1/EgtB/PvdO family nonheme iron enzyme [Bacteroidota bacterium]
MKRNFCLFFLLTGFVADLSSQSEPVDQPYVQTVVKDVPVQYRGRYYYRNADTLLPSIQPGKKTLKKISGFQVIKSGSFKPDIQDGYDSVLNITGTVKTAPFMIQSTEVSNAEYKLFLTEMKDRVYYPDTNCWTESKDKPNPMRHYYFQSEAYNDYPVVGVSHWQAIQYCQWLEEKLSRKLSNKTGTEYRLQVGLPTESEWLCAWNQTITAYMEKLLQKNGQNATRDRNYLDFVFGPNGYRCNFGDIQTERLGNAKQYGNGHGIWAPVKTTAYPNTGGLYSLAGNVSEWTDTRAQGNLYNRMEYIHTTSGAIIRNTQEIIDSIKLAGYLHTEDNLQSYYAVKGGSFAQELYYIQPAAMEFVHEGLVRCYLGFRPVIRFYKKH